jgi:hypothetical protein
MGCGKKAVEECRAEGGKNGGGNAIGNLENLLGDKGVLPEGRAFVFSAR